jgi:hypothetical protein
MATRPSGKLAISTQACAEHLGLRRHCSDPVGGIPSDTGSSSLPSPFP